MNIAKIPNGGNKNKPDKCYELREINSGLLYGNHLKSLERLQTDNDKSVINYMEILLKGYCNWETKRFLENYLYREWKKAEKENYELSEFFRGLRIGKDKLDHEIEKKKNKHIVNLGLMIDAAVKGNLTHDKNDLKKFTPEQLNENAIRRCKILLHTYKTGNHRDWEIHWNIDLNNCTQGAYSGTIFKDDIELIGKAITLAWIKAKDELNTSTPDKENKFQQSETKPQPGADTLQPNPASPYINEFTQRTFKTVIKEYKPKTQTDYCYIWHYFKKHYEAENKMFNFTQDQYRDYIKEHYNFTINKKKFESEHKNKTFLDKVKPAINNILNPS